MNENEREKRERIEKISKHIHPHDDEPDPTATWETITSHKCCLLSALDLQLCLSCQ